MLCCRVLPTPRKNLTDTQTAELIRVAALPPARKMEAYKAILTNVVSGFKLFKQWGIDVTMNFMRVRHLP